MVSWKSECELISSAKVQAASVDDWLQDQFISFNLSMPNLRCDISGARDLVHTVPYFSIGAFYYLILACLRSSKNHRWEKHNFVMGYRFE